MQISKNDICITQKLLFNQINFLYCILSPDNKGVPTCSKRQRVPRDLTRKSLFIHTLELFPPCAENRNYIDAQSLTVKSLLLLRA